MVTWNKIKKWMGFPPGEKYREEIERNLIRESIRPYRNMTLIIMVMQVFMSLTFLFKEGGPFSSLRRSGYFFLYLFLLAVTLAFFCILRSTRLTPSFFLRSGVVYSALICFWACGITLLDQEGGNGLIVFCYMLPTVAALSVLQPAESMIIFGGSCLALNLFLVMLPTGIPNLFSNLVNSIFITVLSVFISANMYHRKIREQYDQIIIHQQYGEIMDMNRRLNQMVLTDELAQMHNRRYLEEVVQAQLEAAREEPVSGLMIDIDYFKQYNDHYGHLAGDQCIRVIAGMLKDFCTGEGRFAVRYGGEEFFLCLLETDAAEALSLAEKIRAAVEDANFGRKDVEKQHVTISIGVATLPADGKQELLTELLSRADKALYQAKEQGRNRVIKFTEKT